MRLTWRRKETYSPKSRTTKSENCKVVGRVVKLCSDDSMIMRSGESESDTSLACVKAGISYM